MRDYKKTPAIPPTRRPGPLQRRVGRDYYFTILVITDTSIIIVIISMIMFIQRLMKKGGRM
jgi:hypothetical protein